MKSKKWSRRRLKSKFKNLFGILPKLNRIFPQLIAREICSVQPLSQVDFFNKMEEQMAYYAKIAKFGSFYPSWLTPLIFDGKEFIPAQQFINWFGRDKILKSKREIYLKMRGIL